MGEQSMVERCARAASHALTGGHPAKPKSIDYAAVRAVLAELREPTEAMLKAAPLANRTVDIAPGLTQRMEMLGGDPMSVWRAMIDAALSEDRR